MIGLMIVITMSCQSQHVRMFDGVSLKCMLTWHTDYLENKNLPLHLENVADPWFSLFECGDKMPLSFKHCFDSVFCLFCFLQRNPSYHAVPEREQLASDTSNPPGGDHCVFEYGGQHRELCGRHQQWSLGHCPTGHPVSQAPRQDPHRPL